MDRVAQELAKIQPMDRVAQELAKIQQLALDADEPEATAAMLGALRRQLERKLPPGGNGGAAVAGGSSSAPAVRSEHHLLFLVHGIGRHDDFMEGRGLSWDGMPDGQGNGPGGNKEFRDLLETQLKTRLRSLNAQLEVHSVEWHSEVRGSEGGASAEKVAAASSGGRDSAEPREAGSEAADAAAGGGVSGLDSAGAAGEGETEADDEALLRACMPEGVADMRSFMRENVMDGLYYMSRAHCQKVVDAVAGQLRSKYETFVSEHPGFEGGVSVMAHSFGSVIIYDLLSKAGRAVRGIAYPRLPFSVDCFFTCGSPAAMFLVSRRLDQVRVVKKCPVLNCF